MHVASVSSIRQLRQPALAMGLLAAALAFAAHAGFVKPASAAESRAQSSCIQEATGITLPNGFCATVFADNLGHVRHMAIAANGTLYVNIWGAEDSDDNAAPRGGYLVALKDTTGGGHADVIRHFGETAAEGGHGGTGIALYHDAVYAESNDRIMRYPLASGEVAPTAKGEVVLSGLPLTGDHPMHPFTITPGGDLLVDLGSATNACQRDNRMLHAPGRQPCTEKETRGGIWRYDANKTGQRFSPAERYVSGIRNGEGISLDASGRIFSTQHGRDQLHENWPERYTAKEGQELPAEEIVELKQGADYGWPECYFDGMQKKLMLAPEYGGDGKKVGLCATRTAPAAFFPAHWAPNDMVFYEHQGTTNGFPFAYRDGAFVAFHGSWNRAPGPQGGYNVVYQPFRDGKASAPFVVFADGFAGAIKEPGQAAFRPTGLAVAPDGALFISDDVHGRIWRVTWQGGSLDAPVAAAAAPDNARSTAGSPLPPEGIHADAGRELADLPVPPGSSTEQVALGERVFRSQTCTGCHGSNGKGSALGANLTAGTWLWSDGSLQGLRQTILNGVPQPKAHTGAMPPMGGAQLSQADLSARRLSLCRQASAGSTI